MARAMSGRPHLSIGDVLSLLRQEFSDVTISKIRFLESQGLIDPERSASGYRKFYEEDVERLRWVLRKQRDQFLPLKVIRDRLAAAGSGVPTDDEAFAAESSPDELESVAPRADRLAQEKSVGNGVAAGSETLGAEHVARDARSLPEEAPARTPAHAAVPGRTAEAGGSEGSKTRPPRPASVAGGAGGVGLTLEELCLATGIDESMVSALEGVGLVSSISIGGGQFYPEEAVAVCKLSAAFGRFGIEPRHLRVFKNAAEREVDLIEQIVTPLLRQRNPEAHRRAGESAQELAHLGEELRASLVRTALHRQFGV